MPLLPTTELEAVNRITSTIGNSPVTTIAGIDALAAQRYLQEASRILQLKGWWFNREEQTLSPTLGEYTIPADVLSVEHCDKFTNKHLIHRADKLFNTETRLTTGHTDDIEVVLVVGLDFEELPESARLAVMAMAGLKFADRSVGDRTIHSYTEADVREGQGLLMAEELRQGNYSGNNSPNTNYILSR